MPYNRRKQVTVLLSLVLLYALLTYVTYVYFLDDLTNSVGAARPETDIPPWILGLANAGIVLVIYGLAGLAAIWFAARLALPAVYREGAGLRELFTIPFVIGTLAGVVLVLADRLFMQMGDLPELPHPAFPLSIIASATAGIGEEILFRGLVFGLWAFLLNLLLRRWHLTSLALWLANLIAALAFAAGHFPAVMYLYNVTTPADLPGLLIVEILVLNTLIALPAGWQTMRDGLVAAIGVHFWADIVWHVIWPLIR